MRRRDRQLRCAIEALWWVEHGAQDVADIWMQKLTAAGIEIKQSCERDALKIRLRLTIRALRLADTAKDAA